MNNQTIPLFSLEQRKKMVDYSVLPTLREVLQDDDLEAYAKMDEVNEYRWITSIKRIDWHKFFNQDVEINELVVLAANSIPNNPVGYLRPDFVNRALQKYSESCPENLKRYAASFRAAVQDSDKNQMREWFEIIENFI